MNGKLGAELCSAWTAEGGHPYVVRGGGWTGGGARPSTRIT
ncbi:MAG: hypothetical protein ABSA54_14405 [Terriglobales bacterium]